MKVKLKPFSGLHSFGELITANKTCTVSYPALSETPRSLASVQLLKKHDRNAIS